MSEYISREAVMDALFHEQYGYLCEDAINSIPAADVVPAVRGKWLLADDGDGKVCSICKTDFCDLVLPVLEWNFCPNCGAKMDGDH